MHVAPAQQPLGHDVASQTQAPATHRCPTSQAEFEPHWQTPPTHESAPKPQVTHAPPPMPHAVNDGVRHVAPAQQPEGHELESQTQAPPTHRWPAPHAGLEPHWQTPPTQESAPVPQATHAPPPPPHAKGVGVVQIAPAQQPLAQETGSQTQIPFAQRWPTKQSSPWPQYAWQVVLVRSAPGTPFAR